MTRLITLLVLGITAATPAFAVNNDNNAGRNAGGLFNRMDSNGNGDISKDEHAAFSQKRFTRIDGNSDGKITKAEFMDFREDVADNNDNNAQNNRGNNNNAQNNNRAANNRANN